MAAPVRMTRRVTFSSGHRYWIPALTLEENRDLFGRWASPYNHGHNYVLDVAVEGRTDETTGMVVNIKRIDDVLKAVVVSQFDQKSINDEIPFFETHACSTENIASYITDQLDGALPFSAHLIGIRLEETPTLFVQLDLANGRRNMTLTRTYEFAASHRLYTPLLSEHENFELYGKCMNPAGHGHNYVLEVTVSGDPDERSGMMVDISSLDRAVGELVVERYDHKNLNSDIPEFEGRVTTSEVVAQEIFDRLDGKLPASLARVRLHETARNVFEVCRRSIA